MDVLIVLIPIAALLGIGFTISFIWSVHNGQFDDLETPANKLLLEEEHINIKKGEPTPASGNENSGENTEDQAALYYKIPVNYIYLDKVKSFSQLEDNWLSLENHKSFINNNFIVSTTTVIDKLNTCIRC